MLLDKIQHYFKFVFVVSLVLVQGMIFVATKAYNSSDYDLSAVFVEPIVGYSIPAGEQVDIEARLSTNDSNDFSIVYFTVASYDETISLNFNAENQGEGTWSALTAWDTTNWPAGVYTLSATTDVHDENGWLVDTYSSMPQLVNLVATAEEAVAEDADVQAAFPTVDVPDIATDLHFISPDATIAFPPGEEYYDPQTIDFILESDSLLNMDATATTLEIYNAGDPDGAPLINLPSGYSGGQYYGNQNVDVSALPAGEYMAFFISAVSEANGDGGGETGDPINQPVVTNVQFTIYREEGSGMATVISPEEGEQVSGLLELEIQLRELLPDQTIVEATIYSSDDIAYGPIDMTGEELTYTGLVNTGNLVSGGVYRVDFVAITAYPNPLTMPLASASFVMLPQVIEVPYISLITPTNHSTINYSGPINLSLSTNYVVTDMTYELRLNSDNSITTGSIEIPYVDGRNWSTAIDLDDTFVTGTYELMLSASPPADFEGGDEILFTTADILINMDSAVTIDPDLVELDIFAPSGSWSGEVDLLAEANFSGLDVLFVLEETATEEVYTYTSTEVGMQYAASIDTTQLPNVNYKLYVKAIIDETEVLSETVPVTIFNAPDYEDIPNVSIRGLAGETSGIFRIIVTSSQLDDPQGINFIFTHQETRDQFEFFVPRSDWDKMEELGFNRDGNEDVEPYVYVLTDIDSRGMLNGSYDTVIEDYNNQLGFVLYIFNEVGGIILKPLLVLDEISGEVDIWFASSHDQGVTPFFENQETGEKFRYNAYLQNSWDGLLAEGIYQADYEASPYLFHNTISTDAMPNGEYLYYIEYANAGPDNFVIDSNVTVVLVSNDVAEQPEEEQAAEQEQAGGGGETISADAEVLIGIYTSCLDVGITDQATCQKFRAIVDLLDEDCIEQGIFDQPACEDYLSTTIVEAACQAEGIVNSDECRDYLLERYGANVTCWLESEEMCRSILRDSYLNRLVVGQKKQESIGEAVDSLIGRSVTVAELGQELGKKGINSAVLPITSENTRVYLAESQRETILEEEDKLTILNRAIMIIDTDGDGLSDDLEGYYGTDINNPDTDGDSYPDGTEVGNGYNPLGEGRLEQARTDFDEAMLAGNIIEQPKDTSDKIDKRFKVYNLNNLETGLELKGTAAANTWITLFLYSDLPLVMTTKTDASGNWSYGIKESLTDGQHRVFVTINDDTGKIVKQSSPVSFLVKRAQAVTANNYFDTSTTQDNVDSLLIYYVIGAGLLVVLALAVIMFLHRNKRSDDTIEVQDG